MPRPWALRLATALVVAAVAVPRVFDLESDPADYWPYRTAWGDEGNWNYPAAYAAVAGDWPTHSDQSRHLVPLYAWAQRLVFSLAGTGLSEARVLSAACGLASVLLVAVLLRPLGPAWMLFAAALHGTNFWVIAVDRLASPEALCLLLLTSALAVATAAAAHGRHWLAALALAATAVLAKPPAAFGIVTVLLYALWLAAGAQATPRRRFGLALGGLALLVVTVVLTLPLAAALLPDTPLGRLLLGTLRLYDLPLTFAEVVPFGGGLARAWVQPLLFSPFAVHFGVALAGSVALLAVPGRAPAEALERVQAFALLWIAAWWVMGPFTGLRGLRFVFLAPALSMLGVAGFARLRAWLESPPPRARLRRVAPAGTALWLLAMGAAWLAEHTPWRARVWWPLLAGGAALVLAAARVTWRDRPLGGATRRAFVPAAVLAVAAQLATFVLWAAERTHFVAGAQRTLAALDLGERLVCARQAAAVLLPAPRNGRALDLHYYPDCRAGGHTAELVLFPRSQECLLTDRRPLLIRGHARLLAQPELARVPLTAWDESRRLICDYSLVALPPGPSDTRRGTP